MSAVYIVTAGGYADYRIVAVFSTEELAKVRIEKGQLERACIERYDLDPPSEWRSITNVCMRHDGSTFNISTELVYEQGPRLSLFSGCPGTMRGGAGGANCNRFRSRGYQTDRCNPATANR